MDDPNRQPAELLTTVRKAGLTESQARGYLALIEHGQLSPVQLANYSGESRTNGYMICEKLEKLGLATKKVGKKTLYTPAHPSNLESLAERRRKALVLNEQAVKNSISPLIDMFYASTELPGTRTLQGIEGIKEVYEDVIRTRETVYLLRTPADIADLGEDFIETHRQRRVELGIHTKALTPLSSHAIESVKNGSDEQMLFDRTFYPPDSYDAPVEIQVYGDKCALIAYGNTQMATLIHSPVIASAMRQLLELLIHAYTDTSKEQKAKILTGDTV